MKRLLVSFAALFALLIAGGQVSANDKTTRSFGALETMSVEVAKAKAEAWLKDAGKSDAATQQRLQQVWSNADRTLVDRLADSFALGNDQVAKLLADARNPYAPAPTALPDVLKDDKQPAFFRANLATAYARALSNRRIYEESLEVFKTVKADQTADPAAYLFFRAVAEHALLNKPAATQSINRLLEEAVSISPERYKSVAMLMLLDMHTWKEKDLGAVARKMENVERRLELARGGPQTQKLQKEVVDRLDELIKQLENKKKQKGDGT